MGKIFQGVFGGSRSSGTSESSNKAYDTINSSFSPWLSQLGSGASSLAALLGGDPTGFNAYKNATGFDATAEAGSRGITGNAAANGLLRSGSTGKALTNYGVQLQNQFATNYMDKLLGQAGLGLQAGNAITNAGNTSQSSQSSSTKPGIGKFLGSVASGIAASDRRLKKDIVRIGEFPNGLVLYQYKYINDEGPFVGVMADEVRTLAPEALGPTINGYDTVDYSKLEGVGE